MLSLTRKLQRGAIWNTLSEFGAQGLNFLVTLVLAIALEPSAFGLIGMVSVFTAFFGYFTEFGLTPSLIQKSNVEPIDEYTVFWATVALSLLFYVVVFLGAPLIARFYAEPRLTSIVRVLFTVFLFTPLAFVPEAILKKELSYNIIAQATLVAVAVSGIFAVALALSGFGVWSLVFQAVSRMVVKSVYLLLLTRWRPRLRFSLPRLRGMIGYGTLFTANNILGYLTNTLDYLIVGKLLGAHSLGLYTLAFRISRYPFMKGWQVFGKMLFPAFAKIREDPVRLLRSYRKSDGLAVMVLLPLLLAVFFGVDSFVLVIVGTEWDGIQPLVRIIALHLFVFSFTLPDVPILNATGKIWLVVVYKFVYASVLAGAGYVATARFGAIGMAAVYSIAASVFAVATKLAVQRDLNLPNLFQLLPHPKVVLATIATFALGLSATWLIRPGLLHLLILAAVVAFALVTQVVVIGVVDIRRKAFDFEKLLSAEAATES